MSLFFHNNLLLFQDQVKQDCNPDIFLVIDTSLKFPKIFVYHHQKITLPFQIGILSYVILEQYL